MENTTAVSDLSWTTRWIIFIAGWWKSSPMATLTPWASILTPHRRATVNRLGIHRFCGHSGDAVSLCISMIHSFTALVLALVLSLGSSFELRAQPPQHRHKSKKPAAPPCREGCKPETAAPQLAVGTPEDDAAEKELSALSRSEEHTSELQSRLHLVCRLLLGKQKMQTI